MPIKEPAYISTRKCCDRYTLEKAMIRAIRKSKNLSSLFSVMHAIIKHTAKIVAACPDGKLYDECILIPSTT